MAKELSKKEKYDLARQQKLRKQRTRQKIRNLKRKSKMAIILAIVGILGGFGWYGVKKFSVPEKDIVVWEGIHWHSQLIISIKGESLTIPGDVGLVGATHQSLHTHKEDNVLHLEFPGLVTKNDIRLARFFEIWGKTFNQECIFDFFNGPEGTVKMFVNGAANFDFENYILKDGDKIEIVFE